MGTSNYSTPSCCSYQTGILRAEQLHEQENPPQKHKTRMFKPFISTS